MRAVVVGGGIAGLSTGIALHRAGWDLTVLEKAPEFGEVGAGISLMANALRGLDALGVGQAIRDAVRTATVGGTRTRTGQWLSRVDSAALARVPGAATAGIHRAVLHRILHDALPQEALVKAAEVVDVAAGPPAEVTYRHRGNTVTVTPDLVVGADGLNSLVRSRLWPEVPPPSYVGSTAWRAVTPHPWSQPLPAALSWGRAAEFGMLPLGDRRVYWYACVNAPPGQLFPDELAAVRERFGSWHAPIPDLLAATPPDRVLRHDLYHLAVPLSTYVKGGVVVVGDAAHAMTPFMGQGGCQAIEDAVVLGAVCASNPHLPAALPAYDAQRRPRTQQIAQVSRRAGRIGQQLSNPLAVAVRNGLMRITPPGAALRAVVRYADWHPPQPLRARGAAPYTNDGLD